MNEQNDSLNAGVDTPWKTRKIAEVTVIFYTKRSYWGGATSRGLDHHKNYLPCSYLQLTAVYGFLTTTASMYLNFTLKVRAYRRWMSITRLKATTRLRGCLHKDLIFIVGTFTQTPHESKMKKKSLPPEKSYELCFCVPKFLAWNINICFMTNGSARFRNCKLDDSQLSVFLRTWEKMCTPTR